MKFIKITSKGEIDEKAFYLIGASSKRADNTKIGMFGSGLKYSLAFILRNEIPLRVFSGYKEIKFSTTVEDFRDKSFNVICINGRETSMTTEMGGVDWNHWSIIRELYCNAIDESEASISLVKAKSLEALEPVEDFTAFYIGINDEFQKILDDWNLYFSENRKDLVYHDDKFNQIYSGGDKMIIYRKGIRCHYVEKTNSLFHYDLSWVKINESRVLENEWEFRYNLVKFLRPLKSKDAVHRIIYNINDYWEKNLDWSYHSEVSFSEEWLTALDSKYLIPYENAGFWEEEIKELKSGCVILPSGLIKALKTCFGDSIKVIGDDIVKDGDADKKVINELNKREQYLLDEAVKFLVDGGYEIKFPIKICKFVKSHQLGQAKDEIIFLSDKVLTMGKREIINTIIEENHHLVTGFEDETRAMQTSLINLYISSLEDKLGRYL